MLQVKNATPFKASVMLLADRNGIDTLFAVTKATFTIGASFGLADEQVPVSAVDRHTGDPADSGIRIPSDVSLEKPGTDVILAGSAWAPGGRPTWQMDASVTVGSLTKTVRVSADRVWDAGAGGATVTWLAPFERMPLVWERAFGGSDETDKGPVVEPRNPVGAGFRASNGTKPLAGLALPNVEDPRALITSWKDAPPPAAFCPVAPHWMPRRLYAGTYDKTWETGRAPFLPHDFDQRFCQVAPLGLASTPHLRGGEVVDLRGVTPGGILRFQLPQLTVRATYWFNNRAEARPGALDTVIIEPDDARLVLVWRSALACDKKALKVREVEINVAQAA